MRRDSWLFLAFFGLLASYAGIAVAGPDDDAQAIHEDAADPRIPSIEPLETPELERLRTSARFSQMEISRGAQITQVLGDAGAAIEGYFTVRTLATYYVQIYEAEASARHAYDQGLRDACADLMERAYDEWRVEFLRNTHQSHPGSMESLTPEVLGGNFSESFSLGQQQCGAGYRYPQSEIGYLTAVLRPPASHPITVADLQQAWVRAAPLLMGAWFLRDTHWRCPLRSLTARHQGLAVFEGTALQGLSWEPAMAYPDSGVTANLCTGELYTYGLHGRSAQISPTSGSRGLPQWLARQQALNYRPDAASALLLQRYRRNQELPASQRCQTTGFTPFAPRGFSGGANPYFACRAPADLTSHRPAGQPGAHDTR